MANQSSPFVKQRLRSVAPALCNGLLLMYLQDLLHTLLVFWKHLTGSCANHILCQGIIDLTPSRLRLFVHNSFTQDLLKYGHERFTHDGEYVRGDAVSNVFGTKLIHDVGQQLNVRAESAYSKRAWRMTIKEGVSFLPADL